MPQNYSPPNDKYIIFRSRTPHGIFGVYGSDISYSVKYVDTEHENLRYWVKQIKDGGPSRKRILKIIDASEARALIADELSLLDRCTIDLTKKMAGKNMPFFKVRRHDRNLIKNVRDGLKKIRQRYPI